MTRITLRLFAHCADRLGPQITLELPDNATGDCVADWIGERDDRLRLVRQSCRLALNGEFADWSSDIHDGDEVGVIPPVSGG